MNWHGSKGSFDRFDIPKNRKVSSSARYIATGHTSRKVTGELVENLSPVTQKASHAGKAYELTSPINAASRRDLN